ncbi:hypothetical protein [Lacinutrix sp. MEBiC02404]
MYSHKIPNLLKETRNLLKITLITYILGTAIIVLFSNSFDISIGMDALIITLFFSLRGRQVFGNKFK